MTVRVNYTPPPTIKDFIKDYRPGAMFYNWIVGPVGSGKTTGIFMKLVTLARMQAPSDDGIRRTRAVIVRNTMPQLRDTTLSSWNYWFKHGQAGYWRETDKKFTMRFGDVECEVMFRALDTAEDVSRVLSLEVTFAIIDEFVDVPRAIIDALAARCGRYPSKAMVVGGATNWGMWGSSNPHTEDNWWYDYLHTEIPSIPDAKRNARYFHQPSGLSPQAENVENLPGGVQYYYDQMVGKQEAWIKQYIEAEWGFSISGKAVIPGFNPQLHISDKPLIYNPHLPLVIGMDPGLGGSAFTFSQQETWGRLNILGELVQSGFGAERLITERLKPYLRRRFPDLRPDGVIIETDPAASNRTQTDEKTVVDIFKRHYVVKSETNNRLPLRINAIEHFTGKLVEGKPALLIDKAECPTLIRALKGGWRFEIKPKNDEQEPKPEKNSYSHSGDSFGYTCRHFHRQTQREERYSGGPTSSGPRRLVIPRRFSPAYHVR